MPNKTIDQKLDDLLSDTLFIKNSLALLHSKVDGIVFPSDLVRKSDIQFIDSSNKTWDLMDLITANLPFRYTD